MFYCGFVDDGSTDDTVTRLQNMQRDHDNKIEIIIIRKNQGKAEALYGEIARLMQQTQQWVVLQYDYGIHFGLSLRSPPGFPH